MSNCDTKEQAESVCHNSSSLSLFDQATKWFPSSSHSSSAGPGEIKQIGLQQNRRVLTTCTSYCWRKIAPWSSLWFEERPKHTVTKTQRKQNAQRINFKQLRFFFFSGHTQMYPNCKYLIYKCPIYTQSWPLSLPNITKKTKCVPKIPNLHLPYYLTYKLPSSTRCTPTFDLFLSYQSLINAMKTQTHVQDAPQFWRTFLFWTNTMHRTQRTVW